MVKPLHPLALFRYGILGVLVNRERLASGELKEILENLSKQIYTTPDGKRAHYSYKAIERWYYAYRRGGIDALAPQHRQDQGKSQIPAALQSALLQFKKENPSRSLQTLIHLSEQTGIVGQGKLSRASVHRLLKTHGLSQRTMADAEQIERRRFEARQGGDIWYSDVMHAIQVNTSKGLRKTYGVTFMDDATRFICHSAFYLNESVESIEHALKEALLKRGLPKKLIIDNGAAYRAGSLQAICARLKIQLIYCRPYEPEGKGKLERWHRTVRETFLTELNKTTLQTLDELNGRWWAWIEEGYHQQPHQGLDKQTPLERWRQALPYVQPLGEIAKNLDDYFYHRIKRTIRKDGSLSFNGQWYEVSHAFTGKTVYLVIDPYAGHAKGIETLSYEPLGPVHRLDKQANCDRRRQRPERQTAVTNTAVKSANLIETLYQNRLQKWDVTPGEK